jgi:hypothetical protein
MTWIALPSGTMIDMDDLAGVKAYLPRPHDGVREFRCVLKNVRISSNGATSGNEMPGFYINEEDYIKLREVLMSRTVGAGYTPSTDVPAS